MVLMWDLQGKGEFEKFLLFQSARRLCTRFKLRIEGGDGAPALQMVGALCLSPYI